MAVGNKNVGKSTALRILLSRLALAGTPVAFLECDIGQSEFTAPGMVSLNLVESPIFGTFHSFFLYGADSSRPAVHTPAAATHSSVLWRHLTT